jgi:hypothetical protein
MILFLWGATALGCALAGLFFLRFWRTTGDRFFAFFAAAFFGLAANWTILAIAAPPDEARHLIYVIRVVAFLLISYAIVDKNRARRP